MGCAEGCPGSRLRAILARVRWRRQALAGVVLLAAATPTRAARADSPPSIDGVPLAQWATRLDSTNEKTQEKAADALGRARFLVGAAEIAVPALERKLAGGGIYMVRLWCLGALEAYGPLAAS